MAAGGARGSRPRRVSLPGVSEILRPVARAPETQPQRPASGREGHSQKITVYLSASELLELERARLALRTYGIAVDRGRIGGIDHHRSLDLRHQLRVERIDILHLFAI